MINRKLTLGLPSGSLQVATLSLFKRAGFTIKLNKRSYVPSIDDDQLECLVMRAQEIPRYVESGILDFGLSGQDWVLETGANVVEVAELAYTKTAPGRTKLVLAVPNGSTIRSAKDLQGKLVATELVNVTKRYLARYNVKANVEFSWGSTEVKPPRLADAIAEITETGTTLKANDLKVIDTIIESATCVMANRQTWCYTEKRRKIQDIADLLTGALYAETRVGLKMNVPSAGIKQVIAILPALTSPSVSTLTTSGWIALEAVIEERQVRALIPELKRLGVAAIVEYPLNKIVL